jgi:hypothetical protein
VWFDFLGLDSIEYTSAYAAKDGKIVTANCASDSIRVRPAGQNSTYPPKISSGKPEGYHITLDLPDHGVLTMDVAVSAIILDFPIYGRFTAHTSGSVTPIKGGRKELSAGVALLEQFAMTN